MRRIVFPRVWPARAVASRTLPVTLQPIGPDAGNDHDSALGVPGPLPTRGGFVNVIPGSARIIDAEGITPGRAFIGGMQTAQNDLDSGHGPDRIDRETTARDKGKIAVGAGPDGIMGWPYDANAMLIPHVAIPRRPITVTPFARTIDTGVTIPAAPIGDPVSVA